MPPGISAVGLMDLRAHGTKEVIAQEHGYSTASSLATSRVAVTQAREKFPAPGSNPHSSKRQS